MHTCYAEAYSPFISGWLLNSYHTQADRLFVFVFPGKDVKEYANMFSVLAIIGLPLLTTLNHEIEARIFNVLWQQRHCISPTGKKILWWALQKHSFQFWFPDTSMLHEKRGLEQGSPARYLRSWSILQHHIQSSGCQPGEPFVASLNNSWKAGEENL